jgi:PhnB protein
MPSPVPSVPPGYHSITPYLYLDNATAAIEFYKKAFGAKEVLRMDGPAGKIGHAELEIGDSRLMLADEAPQMGARSAKSLGGAPGCLMIYVDDVDQVVERALSAGATLTRAVKDQFYGDRSGMIADPFGHSWAIATHKEDVSPEEMQRRAAELAKQG